MNEQVLSIEQMRHLKELGVDTSKASMVWSDYPTDHWMLFLSKEGLTSPCHKPVLAFTLQDMLTIMPKYLKIKTEKYCTPVDCLLMIDVSNDFVYYEYRAWGEYECAKSAEGANLLKSAYNLLCWLAENDYLNKK